MADESIAIEVPVLKAWHDGVFVVIAESVEEAIKILEGKPWGIPRDEQTAPEEWGEVPAHEVFTIDDDPPQKKTIAEWIKSNGKGYLCATEDC